MKQSDYDSLLRQGYTEEEIAVALDEISRFIVSSEPLGPNRDDRGVRVRDANGVERKTSSIMMGYNRANISLENGDYVSWQETEEALNKALESADQEQVLIAKRTGKKISPPELVEAIFKEAVKHSLHLEATDKITNQTAYQMAVQDEGKVYPKGISMLGNGNLQLPSGEYVSLNEFREALRQYVKMTKEPIVDPIPPKMPDPTPIKPPSPEPQPSQDPIPRVHEPEPSKDREKVHRVIKRYYKKASLIPLVIGATALIISGFGRNQDIQEMTRQSIMDYQVGVVEQLDETFETSEDALRRLLTEEFSTGEKVTTSAGTPYYASSDHAYGGDNASGTFGSPIRPTGDYNIDGYSILSGGKIVRQEWRPGMDLLQTLEEVSRDTNTPLEQLEPMIHLGGPVSGWVNVMDLFPEEEKTPQVIAQRVVIDREHEYSGTIENFQGDFITVGDDEESVTLKVTDDDGNLLQPGSVVKGSDGKDYRLSELSVEETEILDVQGSEIERGISWSVHNIALEEALAIAAMTAAATYLSSKIKRKEMVDMTDSEIDDLTHDAEERFKKSREDFAGESAFVAAVENITEKSIVPPQKPREQLRDDLINHEITVEDIEQMGPDDYDNSKGGVRK